MWTLLIVLSLVAGPGDQPKVTSLEPVTGFATRAACQREGLRVVSRLSTHGRRAEYICVSTK